MRCTGKRPVSGTTHDRPSSPWAVIGTPRPEVTKHPDFTHKRTNHELSLASGIGCVPQRGGESVTVFPGRSLGAPDTAAPARGAVCRTFGLKRITLPTLIDFLAWIGWSAGL